MIREPSRLRLARSSLLLCALSLGSVLGGACAGERSRDSSASGDLAAMRESLRQARAHYLERFEQELEAAREPGVQVFPEAALRDADGRAIREGALNLPLRVDLVLIHDGVRSEDRMVDSVRTFGFDPVRIEGEGLPQITVEPFHWDWCEFHAVGLGEQTDWTPLIAWFDEWYKEDESPPVDARLEGVHFLSDPIYNQGGASFSLDLGSAPWAAFEDLMEALGAAGAREVTFALSAEP